MELHLNFETPFGSKTVKIGRKDSKDGKTTRQIATDTTPALILKSEVNTGLAFRWIHVWPSATSTTSISTRPT